MGKLGWYIKTVPSYDSVGISRESQRGLWPGVDRRPDLVYISGCDGARFYLLCEWTMLVNLGTPEAGGLTTKNPFLASSLYLLVFLFHKVRFFGVGHVSVSKPRCHWPEK